MKFLIVLLILLTALTYAGNKPSWCNNAQLYVEKRICVEPELMNLESELLETYRLARDGVLKSQQKALKLDQRKWIKTRNKTCDGRSDPCIKKFYTQRIEELDSITVGKKKPYDPHLVNQFKNATYKNIEQHPATLTDGEWISKPYDGTGLMYNSVRFSEILLSGDLNGNGHKEYVILLYQSGGGSGIFSYLAIMIKRRDKFINLDTVLLGDRVDILSEKIQNGNIILKIKDQGPDDPMCCPTRVAEHIWKLQNNRLKKIKGPNEP